MWSSAIRSHALLYIQLIIISAVLWFSNVGASVTTTDSIAFDSNQATISPPLLVKRNRIETLTTTAECDFFLCSIAGTPQAATTFLLGTITLLINVIAFFLALYNMDYPPLRAKQLLLVGLGLMGGCCWFYGFMLAAGLLIVPDLLPSCPFWTVVVQISLGSLTIVTTILLRLYRLFRVIVQTKPVQGLDYLLWWVVILLPSILIAIFGLSLPEEYVNFLNPETGQCKFNPTYKFVIISLIGLMIFIVGGSIYYVGKRIHISAFNEFRENKILLLFALVAFFFNLVFNATKLFHNSWAQMIVAMITLIIVHMNFWILIWEPLYACYFNREDYLMDFLIELNGAGQSSHGTSDPIYSNSTCVNT